MGPTSWAALRDLISERYDELKARLTRRLGSEELARESLNETWLRLNRPNDAGTVDSPTGYVMRMAVNVATDHRRAESRRARRADVTAALEIADPAPDPAREVEARQQLDALRRALAALPPRTRDILIAARLEGRPQQEIADRYGISPRMVRIELRRALDYCEAELEENATEGFLLGASETSIEKAPGDRTSDSRRAGPSAGDGDA
ncbi:sigma-70 family RNA polymerase sigma factor [Bradyrhizobium sp. U87765 SZCCT0131]|uniref:RNA polymerase sigma factor n=1 Tax=unclassified Bradyrhizobium TaxID=2631580 RepID=UPI001BA8CC5C|nr:MULTISPECIES: sigma-70 family RNA polymerase sigma factor [unclassified Bradyrhizobium]MBR1218970.1 sigma-70 family RNA polymerase sigma factor [Bradyrhizobium sp. U87765 SZCCT0131]MBR1261621.1 sigma-70 family RNA polymerase sigma factor [Bradyrhizobium sp. U87765 SZCCT0134]MBR1306526.1 sigma-70 family RNA polymerase sigma factor [Bradyrhizobium sp. U87765 SZCCT0110]MBR1317403.1 sigma-70 family RNA polymerase sigma factor [Bradyrhizobium sp. U87765 SZCCT0109]MBR1351105.1 sigma-70 family RNA